MEISAKDIKELRNRTGAGMMDCKEALEEAEGDIEKAIEIVREKGILIAEKKASRETGAGILESYIHNNRVGVLLELRSETDFAAKSDPIQKLAKELAMQVASMNPEDVDELLEQPYIRDNEVDVEEYIKRTVAEVGENIEVARFCRYEL